MIKVSAAIASSEYSELSSEEQVHILQVQQIILEAMALGGEAHGVISRLCQLEEQLLPNSVGTVMLLDKNRQALNVYAAPSIPADSASRLNGLRPGPHAGSCGNAVYSCQPQFVQNTFTDERWRDLRHLAHDFNLCSCWSMPVFSAQGEVVGSFALSSFEHRQPAPFHRKLLEIGAALVGIALERKQSEASLKLFEQVFKGSEEGILITDALTDILYVNQTLCRLMGFAEEDVIGRQPRIFSSGRHAPGFYEDMWRQLASAGHWRGEIWNRRRNGEIFPEWLNITAVRNDDGVISHYIGIFSDLSERKHAEQRISFLSTHDALTGLPNRQQFRERFAALLRQAAATGADAALVTLDIDHFKLLNDSLGHAAGDSLLVEVAKRITACAEVDIACRQGGDEFLLGMMLEDGQALESRLQKLQELVAMPILLDGRPLSLSCSLGVARCPRDGDHVDALTPRAGKARDAAKAMGRNVWCFYEPHMDGNSLEHLSLSHELREAIGAGQLVLHYQPQVDLASGRLIGAEALVRWRHPSRGMMSPAAFIPLAEQTGAIVPLGEWVLAEACRQAAAWQAAGLPPLMVAVNLSAVQLRRGNIEDTIARALADSGLESRWLEIELTESALLHDMERMPALIARLKALGLRLSIDDFGTGYSSLAYLKQFRVDSLKIDQSFVRDMASDSDAAAIVTAIVQMGHTLNLFTIAEGVEDQAVLDSLRATGCDAVQGYHYSRPLPAGEFAVLLAAWPVRD